jgi:hypothetical protein
VNPLPEFLEPISEFEMWRDYREKRNRRAFYFLALLLVLLIVASALPSTTGPVFGTGDTSSEVDPSGDPEQVLVAGEDGEDGRDGLNGRPGRDGEDGQDGTPGVPGAPGASGPAGPPGASGSGGGGSSSSSNSSLGQGVLRVGTCDTDIAASLRSRISVSGGNTVFYFKTINLSGIDSACNGKNIDIYLLDSSGNPLATALNGTVSGANHSVQYTSFSGGDILASAIDSIALEIAD